MAPILLVIITLIIHINAEVPSHEGQNSLQQTPLPKTQLRGAFLPHITATFPQQAQPLPQQ
jgi:hypothetical protein